MPEKTLPFDLMAALKASVDAARRNRGEPSAPAPASEAGCPAASSGSVTTAPTWAGSSPSSRWAAAPMPEKILPYAVGDWVTVTSHYSWCGRDTHGHDGRVVDVVGEDTPMPLYNVQLDGFTSLVPMHADELELAGGAHGAGS